MGKNVVLTPDEAITVTELLLEDLNGLGLGKSAEDQRRLWRLAVKLDKAVGTSGLDGLGRLEIPMWVRKLLQQTFAPDQVAPKKKPAQVKKPTTRHSVSRPAAATNKKPPTKAATADFDPSFRR